MTEKLKKIKRTTDDILIMITDEEEMFRKKFITQKYDSDEWKCTVCSKITKDKPYPHPALRVSMCFDCLKSYQNTVFRVNRYETDKNCRWCAKESKKFECSQCTVVFCKNCLERNFGADFVRYTVTKDWNCFICFPKPLWRLRVACYKAMQDINQKSANIDEIIDLLSQESQENRLPASQLALPNSENPNEQFSFESPIISPKKPPQPIVESECESDDDNNSLWLTQASNNQQEATNNNNEEMSAAEKKILSEVFKETEKDLQTFIDLFTKRVSQLSQKFICENITSFVQAKKLAHKVSDFCDKAVENLHHVNKNCDSRFQNWSDSFNSGNSLIENEQSEKNCDTNESKHITVLKTEPTPSNNVSLKTVQIKSSASVTSLKELDKDSDSLLKNKKIRSKNTRKYSLSLKTSSKEPKQINEDVTEEKISPTSSTPSKSENSSKKSTPNSSKQKNDTKSSTKKQSTVKDNQKTSFKHKLPKKSPNESEDSFLEVPVKKIKHESSNGTSLSNLLKTNNSQTSIDIKSEETSEDTVIRDSAPSNVTLEDIDREEEFLARIQKDFEEKSANYVTIENYLCDKTGEFCQSYKTGHDSIEDSPLHYVKEEEDRFENDSDKTEDFDWNADFGDLNIIEKLSNVEKTNSSQKKSVVKEVEIIDLPTDIGEEEIKQEQLSQESEDSIVLIKNQDQDIIICEESTDEEEINVKQEQLSQESEDSTVLTKNQDHTIIREENAENEAEIRVKEEQLSQDLIYSTQNQQSIEKESIISGEEENSVKEEQLSEESQKTVKLQKTKHQTTETSEDSSETTKLQSEADSINSEYKKEEENSVEQEQLSAESQKTLKLQKTKHQQTTETSEDSSETTKLQSEAESTDSEYKREEENSVEQEQLSAESQKTLKLQKTKQLTTETSEDSSEESSKAESTNSDSESEREAALRALNSDTSHLSSSSEFSFSDNDSDDSYYRELQKKEREQADIISFSELGYVKQLDIAEELAKLRRNNPETDKERDSSDSDNKSEHSKNVDRISYSSAFEEENSEIEDSCNISDSNLDPKLTTLKPVVKLEQCDYEKYFEERILKSSSDETDDEAEINRLTNMKSLKKRNRILSSDSDSDIFGSRKKRLTKKRRKSSKDSNSDSDSDESFKSLGSDDSLKSLKSEPNSDEFKFKQKDKDYMPPVGEDLLNDSLSDCSVSDDDVIEIKSEEKKKEDVQNLVTDDEDADKSSKEVDEKSKWRKDSLLTGNLNMRNRNSDSETTNDSTANELLRKEEERYFKNLNKKKKSRRKSVESISSSGKDEDDAIILSETEMESDNSDCQIVSLKRKHESDDESIAGKSKKGRRNIKKVLKDSELQEETQKADKEETQRKERLSLKQKAMDSVLSESQLSQEESGLILDVDEDKKKPILTVHYTLVPKLKEHQKKGIKFMWDVCFESVSELKRSKGAGCILAHCMGLGKTMQVVVLSHTLLTNPETDVKHILIVCPLSTVFNWRDEFNKTLRVCNKKIHIYDIRPDKQNTFYSRMCVVKLWKENGGVLMLGYESFQSLVNEKNLLKTSDECRNLVIESLVDPGPGLVVCDEGHMLKNGKTIRFTTLTKVKTKRRIILTGTPLQNNLVEYYYMVNFVKPHLLGTLEEYKNRFVNPISNGQYEDSSTADINLMKKRSHVLHKKLETTVQRYEESELIPYLPPKQDYVLYIQLTPLQIILYEHYLQLLDLNTKKLFKNYHALQNIWTHPALLKIKFDKRKEPTLKAKKTYDEDFVQALDPDSEEPTGLETDWFKDLLPEDILTNVSYGVKMEILFSIIKECELIKDKLLVFSSSIDELDLIETFLKNKSGESWKKGLDYYRMDGTVAPEKRMQYCNSFNDEANPRSRLFLVSHKVGGLGLNLTAANRVVLMDVSWNPAYDTQSMFRVYRFGQTKTCYIYRFVSMGTMEEVVYSRAVTKLAISCRVVDEHQIKRHFNSDDLQRMYRLIKDFADPPTPTLPSDRLLAKLWENHKPLLYKFCDHQSLLENLAHEELNEEEMKLAWEEFGKEIEAEKHAKESINNRFNNFPPGQMHPSLLPYQPQPQQQQQQQHALPSKIVIKRPEDLLPNSLQRFKRPNRLPTANELIQNANNFTATNDVYQSNRFPAAKDFTYHGFNRLTSLERRAFYEKFGVDPKAAYNPLLPSTSTNLNPSTSRNNPSTSTSFSAASTSSAFPSTSSSTYPNYSAPSTSTSNYFRNYNQPLNLSANGNPNSGIRPLGSNNGIRNPTFHHTAPNNGMRNPNSLIRPYITPNNGMRNPTFRPITPNNLIRNPNSVIRTNVAPNNRIRNPFSAVRPNLVPNNRIPSPNSVIRPKSPANGNTNMNSTNSVVIEVPNSKLYKNGVDGKTKIRIMGNNTCESVSTGVLSKSDGQKENIMENHIQNLNTNGVSVISETKTNATPSLTPLSQNHPTK